MKASDYIADFLYAQGVSTVFGYQGGNITHMIDSIARHPQLRYVQTYHEQAAAFAACAYAQVKHGIGVAVSSSGPGATNLITGIANAYFDSIPCLFITGNVNTATMRSSKDVRQSGFQEADIVSMVQGITKYAASLRHENEIEEAVSAAVRAMTEGRPGPALLDLPHNIQWPSIVPQSSGTPSVLAQPSGGTVSEENIRRTLDILAKAQKPLLLLGGGCHGIPQALLGKFLDCFPCPVASSLCGLDLVDHRLPRFLGLIGTYGRPKANAALLSADALLVIGSRLDERQTNGNSIQAKIIHVDIDPHELGRAVDEEISIRADAAVFLEQLLADGGPQMRRADLWTDALAVEQESLPQPECFAAESIGRWFSPLLRPGDIVCGDVGVNQMGLASSIALNQNRLLNSGGLGAMGYALPAAIGACYANKGMRTWAVAGDGGIQMNIQELQTIVRERLPVKIIVVNNKSLEMIRRYHEQTFSGRTTGSVQGYSAPDFCAVAHAYGLEHGRAARPDELSAFSGQLQSNTPFLLEVMCDK